MSVRPSLGFPSGGDPVPDPAFRLYGFDPVVPTILLAVLGLYERYCSFKMDGLLTLPTLFATLTAYMTGKVFAGPGLEVRKSLKLVGRGQYRRPISFMIYDTLQVIPRNFFARINWKAVTLIVVGVVYLFVSRATSGVTEYFSGAFIAVWFLMCLVVGLHGDDEVGPRLVGQTVEIANRDHVILARTISIRTRFLHG